MFFNMILNVFNEILNVFNLILNWLKLIRLDIRISQSEFVFSNIDFAHLTFDSRVSIVDSLGFQKHLAHIITNHLFLIKFNGFSFSY